jgi:RimJ/RimL family protein N-acetyltransferase
MDYAFTQTHVTALNAWVLAENQGSVRLLEKLFTRTQVLEKGYTINGVDYDDWAYRLENAIRRRDTAPYACLHALFHLFR